MQKGFKQTELGLIPDEWKVAVLAECLSSAPKYGINAPASPYQEGIPVYLRITDITSEGRFSQQKLASVVSEQSHEYQLRTGDIVFARTGASVGKSYLYNPKDGELVFAGFLIKITPNSKSLISEYLAAYVTTASYWAWVALMSTRSGQPGINGREFSQLPIPLPPLNEQKAIAKALRDVDALIEGLDKLIAKKREIKQATMQQLLTGKCRLPGFSGEWEKKKLGDIADVIMGQSPSSLYYHTNEVGLPLIQGNADIKNRRTIKRTFTTQITKKGMTGDILLSVRAPVGLVARTTFEICLGRGVCAIRDTSDFLYHYLIHIEPTWSLYSKGSTFDSVNSTDVINLLIHLPTSSDEQTAIAQVLSDMDEEIEALEARRDKTKALKQGMMQELLTGRIRLV